MEDVPEPTITTPTDALVRVAKAGICGSELHFSSNGADLCMPAGLRLGHEFVGVVEAVGEGVRGMAVGDRAVAPFAFSDGDLLLLLPAWPAHLVRARGHRREPLLGRARRRRGRGGKVGVRAGARGRRHAGRDPGGPRRRRSRPRGPAAGRRSTIALKAGATHGINARNEDPVQAVKDLTHGRGADAVVETISSNVSLARALETVRAGGAISVLGMSHYFVPVDQPYSPAFMRDVSIHRGVCPSRAYIPHCSPSSGRAASTPRWS